MILIVDENTQYRENELGEDGFFQKVIEKKSYIKMNDLDVTTDMINTKDEQINLLGIKNNNENIYIQLENLDKKSIRAIRENNQELIAQYENEAIELRSQLK